MTKNQLRAALLGGLIIFIWGMFSWMVFPWHQGCLKKFTNESAVASVIQDNAPVSGVYLLPNTFAYNDKTSQHEMSKGVKMMENGPFMFASVKKNGVGRMSFIPFLISLIIQIIGALIVTWMLAQTKGLSFRNQVGFVALFGLGVGVLSLLPDWNWWGFSAAYVSINILDLVIGWCLAGLGIAKVLKR